MKIEEFLKTIEGLAYNTQNNYRATLYQLEDTLKGDEPKDEEIVAFLQKYQPTSLQRHKAAIKLYLEYSCPGQPWPFNRRQFSAPREVAPRWVPPEVIFAVAEAADNEDDRMFILALFYLGCRIAELMEIEKGKVMPMGVTLRTKGGNEKLKILTRDFYPVLKEYADKQKGPRVFPRPYSYYNTTLKALATKSGHADLTLHTIRHSRAVDLLDKGLSLLYLQQFLGHKSINTTARYTLVHGGKLYDEVNAIENGQSNGKEAG